MDKKLLDTHLEELDNITGNDVDEDMIRTKATVGTVKRRVAGVQKVIGKSERLLKELNDTMDRINVLWLKEHRRIGEKKLKAINELLNNAINTLDKIERML